MNFSTEQNRVAQLPAEYGTARWYAAYTNANHERRVAKQLAIRAIENCLPLFRSVRRWSDRSVQVDRPLFPGYIFVRLPLCERQRVLQIPGVVRFIGFNGLPTALPDEEIDVLRSGFQKGTRPRPHPFLKIGRRVRIKSGPLEGVQGMLLRNKNSLRVVLSVTLIQRSIAVEVDENDLEGAL